ncbi:helix-turn-helix domain-containing protein [[Eubacterium] hominis]|mgnify:CR=1 FL=1|uniref:helix-turn-helix domain-containing protein n=1 Tax=[Eubacterium] hominis TaxID=2764325 RepID=UPI0022E670F1
MNLKRFRVSLRLNQKQMAEKIGVSASYYYKVESGMRYPSFCFLQKLKIAFPKANVDELFF